MTKKCLLAAWLVCAPIGILYAQKPPATPRPTLPSGPMLNRAPDMAQWTVTSRTVVDPGTAPSPSPGASPAVESPAPSPKSSPPPKDQVLTITKTRTIRFEQTTISNGTKIQKWCVPDMQVSIRNGGKPTVVLPGGGEESPYTDYSKTDFGGFEWISKKNFEGIQKVTGQDCLVFRDKIKLEGENARSGPPPSATACISLDGRLPVALQYGEELRTYQFGPAPTDMLTLPPEVESLVNQWRKTLRQASLPPGKP